MHKVDIEKGDKVKIVEDDRFTGDISQGDIFKVLEVKSDRLMPTTLKLLPVESEHEGSTQISFVSWIEKIEE